MTKTFMAVDLSTNNAKLYLRDNSEPLNMNMGNKINNENSIIALTLFVMKNGGSDINYSNDRFNNRPRPNSKDNFGLASFEIADPDLLKQKWNDVSFREFEKTDLTWNPTNDFYTENVSKLVHEFLSVQLDGNKIIFIRPELEASDQFYESFDHRIYFTINNKDATKEDMMNIANKLVTKVDRNAIINNRSVQSFTDLYDNLTELSTDKDVVLKIANKVVKDRMVKKSEQQLER